MEKPLVKGPPRSGHVAGPLPARRTPRKGVAKSTSRGRSIGRILGEASQNELFQLGVDARDAVRERLGHGVHVLPAYLEGAFAFEDVAARKQVIGNGAQ